jgi:hypothetical protein
MADMVKGVFEHQFTSIKETSKEYQISSDDIRASGV